VRTTRRGSGGITAAPKGLLGDDEVRRLAHEFAQTVAFIRSRRTVEPLAIHIQYPKLPAALTEAIVARSLARGAITLPGVRVSAVAPGGATADLVLSTDVGELRVEVKATSRGWTAFNPKDLTADFVVWLDVDLDFLSTLRARTIVIPKLGALGYLAADRLTTQALRKAHGAHIVEQDLDLDWLMRA